MEAEEDQKASPLIRSNGDDDDDKLLTRESRRLRQSKTMRRQK